MIPTNVDCIILGTGLTNSILAAAFSRIGKSVLHVDKNKYYGEEWASFTFQQLIDWIKHDQKEDEYLQDIPEDIIKKSRMFSIDLCPRLLYSNGSMVELLVKSNVSRYHEFKNNLRILAMIDNNIHTMPCKRSDVFTSPFLSNLVDKRRLMKFIELCILYNPECDNEEERKADIILQNDDKPIDMFLTELGLNRQLREYIINSVAMVSPADATSYSCKSIRRFMEATQKYGRSPFLFPLYGCGEFPQSFCRLSAVFGGVYCLNTQIDSVKINQNSSSKESHQEVSSNFIVEFSKDKHKVSSQKLIMDYSSAINLNLTSAPAVRDKLSRAILITNDSISSNSDKLISYMRIPASDKNAHPIHLIELNSSVMVCPPDLNLVYIWTKSSSPMAKDDLNPIINDIFKKNNVIVWKYFYQQLTESQSGLIKMEEVDDLHITSPPSNELDYDSCIKEAKDIFHKMCPDQEFLPRAPDPDEIIN